MNGLRTAGVCPNVVLDSFVVMPNHIHGIVAINETAIAPHRGASTRGADPRRPMLRPNSLGSIIGWFKSVSTKRITSSVDASFGWQPRFHDRVIRNDRECDAIRRYIEQNPMKWALDKDNVEDLLM